MFPARHQDSGWLSFMKHFGPSSGRPMQGGFMKLASAENTAVYPAPEMWAHFPEALILADRGTRVRYLNPAAEQLLGLSLANARGHELDQVLTLQDRESGNPVRVLDTEAVATADSGLIHLLIDSAGGSTPVQYSVSRTRAANGTAEDYIVALRDATGLQQYIDRLVAQTTHDEHTRLLRRAELVKRMWRLLQETDTGAPQAFMYLDLDNFKAINDSAGHEAGDLAIRQIATRFRDVVREQDSLARLGGDEFGLLLEQCPAAHARQRAVELHHAAEAYVLRWNGESFRIGVSIGLALFNTRHHSLNTILSAADAACDQAKRDAGDRPRIKEVTLD